MRVKNLVKGPWLLIGDMNEILSASKVMGGNFSTTRALLFINTLDHLT